MATSTKHMKISVYMEYCPNGTLLMHAGTRDIKSLKKYLLQAHKAVNTVHSYGYLHLDIKPDNFVLDGNDHVGMTEFGSSLPEKREGFVSHRIRGSMLYISPEMRNGGLITVASDYYSFGRMMYRLFEKPSHFKLGEVSFYKTPMELRLVIVGLTSKEPSNRIKAWNQLPALLA
jgi:serine/threonine protein kinase